MRKLQIAAMWMALLVLAGVWTCAAATQSVTLTHQGVLRSYLVHQPPQPAHGAPLLIALHGTSMRAADMLAYTDLPQLADRHGFVLAAPQALGNGFNDGLAPAGSDAAAVDDVGFVEALADDARGRFGVRADAVYVVGFSNGGSMVQRLAIESRYPFAGFAAVASAVRVATPGVARPAPLLLVFGTADPLNPVDGGLVWIPAPHVKPPPAATAQQWAQRLRCDGAPALEAPAAGVQTRVWAHCADGARLAWMNIDGLGHHWAGARPMPFPRLVLGPQLAEPKLGELVWRFLALSASRTSSAAPAPISAAAPPTDKRAPKRFSVGFDRVQMSLDAATQGLGIALESTTMAGLHLADGRLNPVFGADKGPKVKAHFAVYPARHARRAPVEAFLTWIHAEAARVTASQPPERCL